MGTRCVFTYLYVSMSVCICVCVSRVRQGLCWGLVRSK